MELPADFQNPNMWQVRGDVINSIIRWSGFTSYLEIGLGSGENFAQIVCTEKVSVDPLRGATDITIPDYVLTSDNFFKWNRRKFDVIFIDGLHHADQLERDLDNALATLNEGGVILCHDLNPGTEEMQMVPRQQGEWTGDCWIAWVKLRAKRPDLSIITIDSDYGVGIAFHSPHSATPGLSVPEEQLTWANFEKNRQAWLNLMHPLDAARFVWENHERDPVRH